MQFFRKGAHSCRVRAVHGVFLVAVVLAAHGQAASAQTHQQQLTLAEALRGAVDNSPDILAAREGVAVARGREIQAGARSNPTIGYSREQTGSGSSSNSQDVFEIEQPIEIGGTLGARSDAARFRRQAAEARLRVAEAQVSYEVTVAFANAVSAERRAALASQLADAFVEAQRVAGRRLAAGDVSGFATRRIRLETNRYVVLRAEALLQSRTAKLALSSLLPQTVDRSRPLELNLAAVRAAVRTTESDSLAVSRRPDLAASGFEGDAAVADAALSRRERTPVPILSAGAKRESVGNAPTQNGIVAGLRMPLPLWDRRAGSVSAADAEVRRRSAELVSAQKRAQREIAEASDAVRTAAQQLDLMTPEISADASAALRAAQVAYSEGEISLLEWLDAARAYHEMESGFANLRTEFVIRAAALLRATGTPLSL